MAGMMSRGMICGADEIGLATESDGGIMILEQTWSPELLESMIGQSLFDLTLPFPGVG
jgi:tRNA-binding EMAP/Myf-like protein